MNHRIPLKAVALAALLGLALPSFQAFAQDAPAAPGVRGGGHGAPAAGGMSGPQGPHGGRGAHGPHGPRAGHHGPRAGMPMMMLLGPGLDRALEWVKASPEQRGEIRRIAGAARDDLRNLRRADPAQAREGWMTAWSADQLDAAALERQRQQQAARRDEASRRMLQASIDIGKVLRPEQRRALVEHWRTHRPAHRRADAGTEPLAGVGADGGTWEHALHAESVAD